MWGNSSKDEANTAREENAKSPKGLKTIVFVYTEDGNVLAVSPDAEAMAKMLHRRTMANRVFTEGGADVPPDQTARHLRAQYTLFGFDAFGRHTRIKPFPLELPK